MRKTFTEFIGKPNRANADTPRVTLNPRGVMMLNERAVEAFDSPAAVTLHYDEDSRMIALKPVDARRPNAFPLKKKDKQYKYRVIHASPFCRHFGIRLDRTILFHEIDLDDEGVMTLSLRSTTAITRGRW